MVPLAGDDIESENRRTSSLFCCFLFSALILILSQEKKAAAQPKRKSRKRKILISIQSMNDCILIRLYENIKELMYPSIRNVFSCSFNDNKYEH